MGAFLTAESKRIIAERAERAAYLDVVEANPNARSLIALSSGDLLDECRQILAATEAARRSEELVRREAPVIRLHTAGMAMKHVVTNALSYTFEFVENDTGTGETTHFAESEEAQWLLHIYERVAAGEGEAPQITADYVGSRWSGFLDDVYIEETTSGDQIVVATWLHDYERLKWIRCWPTPWLPAAIQFKAWILVGPTDWCALTTLYANLWRERASSQPLLNDPMTSMGNVSNWPIVVNPVSFAQAATGGALWSMPIIRMKSWHDAFEVMLADADLAVQVDRWMTGDDPPWPGANLRHGTLVVSIVDKSGRYNTGTMESGNLIGGLLSTIAGFTADFIDTIFSPTTNSIPGEYLTIGYKSTNKTMPYVIYRPGITPGVVSAKFRCIPAKGVQVITGGKSMPGVNEVIGAIIQAIGDVVGDNLTVFGYGVGSIGGAIDTLLKPLYEHTILAWTQTRSVGRTANAGWQGLFEFFQEGADQAYTLNSLIAIRTGLWATRRRFMHEIVVMDACPWMIGDNGVGHMWLSDRVGTTEPADESGRVWIDRIKKLVLRADESTWHPEWQITIGADEEEDPLMVAIRRIKQIFTGLQDVGLA